MFLSVISLLRTWLISSFIVLQFMVRNTPPSRNISDKLVFFLSKPLQNLSLTGLEPNAVKQYVAGQSGMLFSERPFALGLFLGKQMKQQ